MPNNKNAVIRYIIIDQLLSDRCNKYTCETILKRVNKKLEELGFPTIGGDNSNIQRYLKSGKRVIQMDIRALQDSPFNMEIVSPEKINGSPVYRYYDQTKTLFSKPLSDDEKQLLQEVLNTLGQFSGLDNFEWLNDLQVKLNDKNAFGDCKYNIEKLHKRKIISFSTNNGLKGKQYLGEVFSAISKRKVIDVKYTTFDELEHMFRLYPYILKEYNDRWYLIGKPVDSDKYPYNLNLALDRINSIKFADEVQYIDCDDDYEKKYDNVIGITLNGSATLTEIILAIKNNYKGYVDTKPIHHSQYELDEEKQVLLHNKYPSFKDYTFYSITVIPNRELYNTIYHTGEHIILISPGYIRKDMINELTHTIERLKSIKDE